MARYSDYMDSYLPGEIYSSGLEGILPQQKVDYMRDKRFKFKPRENNGDYFQTFLALQNNPEALFKSTMDLPDTPFGNLGQYLGA